jgi:hypothetical protein
MLADPCAMTHHGFLPKKLMILPCPAAFLAFTLPGPKVEELFGFGGTISSSSEKDSQESSSFVTRKREQI